jgi:hypothetical protein
MGGGVGSVDAVFVSGQGKGKWVDSRPVRFTPGKSPQVRTAY